MMVSWWLALKTLVWRHLLVIVNKWNLFEIGGLTIFYVLLFYTRSTSLQYDVDNISPNGNSSRVFDMSELASYFPADKKWQLWYAPNKQIHREIIHAVHSNLPLDFEVLGYTSRDKLLHKLESYTGSKEIYAIMFDGGDKKQLSYNISIHKPYLKWNTEKLYQSRQTINGYNPYLHEGFIALQAAIDMAYIRISSQKNISIDITMKEIPYRPSNDNGQEYFFLNTLPIAIIFTFGMLNFFGVLRGMKFEEIILLNNLMKASGISFWIILLGWLIQRLLISMFTSILMLVALRLIYIELPISTAVLYLFFLNCYNAATVSSNLLLACLTGTRYRLYMCGGIFGTCSYFLSKVNLSTSPIEIILAVIFPNFNLHISHRIFWNFHNAGTDSDIKSEQLSMTIPFITLIVHIIITLVLATAIDAITTMDSQMFEQGRCCKNNLNGENGTSPDENKSPTDTIGIVIKNLKKKFGVFVALEIDELHLKKGEVTAILGTNGAGKTTLISILAGFLKSYTGRVQMGKWNQSAPRIGYCTQDNVIIPNLTVEQNIQFFAKIRGTPDAKRVAKDAIEEVECLANCNNSTQSRLSSSQRRMLCLIMACVGEPDIIILDEPSRGTCDDVAWDYIKSKKGENATSTVLMVTHSISQATKFANRLIFMNKGKVVMKGTYDELCKIPGHFITITLSQLKDVNDIVERIQSEEIFQGLTIFRALGRHVILQFEGDDKVCGKYIKELERVSNDWNIKKITYNENFIQNLFIKCVQDSTRINRLPKTTEAADRLDHLSDLFENRNYGYKKSLLMKRLVFLLNHWGWWICGIITACSFWLLVLVSCKPGEHYYKYNENNVNLTLNTYNGTDVNDCGNATDISQAYKALINIGECNYKAVPNILCRNTNDTNYATAFQNTVIGAEFEHRQVNNHSKINVTVLFSLNAIHSAPVSLNLVTNAILNSFVGKEYSIKASNRPDHLRSHTDILKNQLISADFSLLWAIYIPIGFLMLIMHSYYFPNVENTVSFIKYQITSIPRSFFYWNINLLFDFITFLSMSLILYGAVALIQSIVGPKEYGIIVVIISMYTIVHIACCYAFISIPEVKQLPAANFLQFSILAESISTILISAMDVEIVHNCFKFLPVFFPQMGPSLALLDFTKKITENHNWNNMNPREKLIMCIHKQHQCCNEESLECLNFKNYFYNEKFGILCYVWASLVGVVVWQSYVVLRPFIWNKFIENVKNIATRPKTFDAECSPLNQKHSTDGSRHEENAKTFPQLIAKDIEWKGVTLSECNRKSCIFRPQCIYAICGEIGSGKSLLTATLAKRHKIPFLGEIYIQRNSNQLRINHPNYKKEIGYISPDSKKMNLHMTSFDFFTMAALTRGYNIKKSRQAAKILIEFFELGEFGTTRFIKNLSKGNLKRVEIAASFIGFPNFVIIDDITKYLDLKAIENVAHFLYIYRDMIQKTTIITLPSSETRIYDHGFDMAKDHDGYNVIDDFPYTVIFRTEAMLGDLLEMFSNKIVETFDAELNPELIEMSQSNKDWQITVNNTTPISSVFATVTKLKEDFNLIQHFSITH